MQMPEIFSTIIEFILSPIFLFAVVMIIVLVAVRYGTKSKSSSGVPVVKQMHRMVAQIDKGKDITEPAVRSRQEIITLKFNSQMKAIGLEPENESGYVPVSYTPLARFLKERGVQDDTVSAILAGLMEEENETDVRAIITAASETPGVDLTGAELAKAQDLAVSEWTNVRRSRSV
ncbi:MAG: hypothetical protein ACFFDQ_11000 [Candidatus Thorarchaeota archaeon]